MKVACYSLPRMGYWPVLAASSKEIRGRVGKSLRFRFLRFSARGEDAYKRLGSDLHKELKLQRAASPKLLLLLFLRCVSC